MKFQFQHLLNRRQQGGVFSVQIAVFSKRFPPVEQQRRLAGIGSGIIETFPNRGRRQANQTVKCLVLFRIRTERHLGGDQGNRFRVMVKETRVGETSDGGPDGGTRSALPSDPRP